MKVDLSKYTNRNTRKVRRLLWEIVWILFAATTPRWALNGWRAALIRLFGGKIGRHVRIYGGSRIWEPHNLTLGENCWIDNQVQLYSVAPIQIGSDVVVSAGSFICTASHDVSSPTFDLVTAPVVIGDCAWICARAIVLPGVSVGEGAVVGAGSVVTKDVQPWTVVAGNPAKVVGMRKIGG